MQEINLNSWDEFEKELQRLKNEYLKRKFLYRGQSNHNWHLSTTLERNIDKELSFREYYLLIYAARPQIESFAGVKWNKLPHLYDFEKWLKKNDTFMPDAFGCSMEFQDIYSYMVYLRHYGFPSPFIDWSTSPYVAAYFAFRQSFLYKNAENNVSIYVYLESTSEVNMKFRSGSEPNIYSLGPYVRTDRRHFLQQCNYTICIIHDDEWQYTPHEKAFDQCNANQDVLWKFDIPSSEGLKVLKLLDSYNINALSLFGSEESLMETMALREIHFRDREL